MYHLADWRHRHAGEICCMGPRFWEKGVFENLTAAENIVFRSMNRFRERGNVINRRMLRLALRDFAAEMGFDPEGLDVYRVTCPVVCGINLCCCVSCLHRLVCWYWTIPFIPLMSRLKQNCCTVLRYFAHEEPPCCGAPMTAQCCRITVKVLRFVNNACFIKN